jgi:hypothetical protein
VIKVLLETSGCPRGVGWAFTDAHNAKTTAAEKIFDFTRSILAVQNYGENRKLRLVANPISAYVRFRQWSLPSPATAGENRADRFQS